MFLHREHDAQDERVDEETRTRCDIIVAKHRNGETGKVTVRWHGEYTTFTDLNERKSTTINVPPPTEFKDNFIIASDSESIGDGPPMSNELPIEPPLSRKEKTTDFRQIDKVVDNEDFTDVFDIVPPNKNDDGEDII
jgi:hypothetical protein